MQQDLDFPVIERALSNGRRALVLPDPRAPVCALHLWLAAGAAHDPVGKSGLAHLTEHMMFRETEHLALGEYDERTEDLGAHINAVTWLDWTCYQSTFPPDALEEMLALEVERFERLRIRKTPFLAERDVVLNERRSLVQDDPESCIGERLMRLFFARHVYARPTIGSERDIAGLEAADVRAFYKRFYASAVPVLCGPIEPSAGFRLLDRYFGTQRLAALPEAAPPVTRQLASPAKSIDDVTTMRLHVSESRLIVAYPTLADEHPDAALVDLLAGMLTGGETGLLYRRVARQQALASHVDADPVLLRRAGMLQVSFVSNPGESLDVKALIAATHESLQRIAAGKKLDDHFEAARSAVRVDLVRGLLTPDERAWQVGSGLVMGDDPRQPLHDWQRIRDVTVRDVAALARASLEAGYVAIHVPARKTEAAS